MNQIRKIPDVFLVVIFLLLFLVNILQVFFRYVLGASLSWSEEIARGLFVWSTYLGMALCSRDKEHIVIDVLSDIKGKKKILFGAEITQKLVTSGIMVFLLVLACRYESSVFSRGLISPAAGIPLWILVLSLIAGCALSIAYIAARFMKEHCNDAISSHRDNAERD